MTTAAEENKTRKKKKRRLFATPSLLLLLYSGDRLQRKQNDASGAEEDTGRLEQNARR